MMSPERTGSGEGTDVRGIGSEQGVNPGELGTHRERCPKNRERAPQQLSEHLRAVPQVAPGARIAAQTNKTSSEMAAEVRGSLALLRLERVGSASPGSGKVS